MERLLPPHPTYTGEEKKDLGHPTHEFSQGRFIVISTKDVSPLSQPRKFYRDLSQYSWRPNTYHVDPYRI